MNAVQNLQDNVQKILDVVNEGKWHPEVALQTLTIAVGSIAIAVNVPLEDLLREAGRGLTDMYAKAGEQGHNVQ